MAKTFIGINVGDAWKLSTYHTLISRLQMKHKAENGMTCNLFAWILTKHLLKKVDAAMRTLASATLNIIDTSHSEEEQVSDLSYISDVEPSPHLYKFIVNTKGTAYRKLRRYIKRDYNKLTTTYCSCCKK